MSQKYDSLIRATVHGSAWAYASVYSGKLVGLISTVILARLLLREDFGVVGYALVVMGYLEILNGIGIGPALIYYPPNPERTNNAFWLGLGIGTALFGLAWFTAPLAGFFFNDSRAVPVTRVLALAFPISALSIVHEAMLRKNLAFKLKTIPDFVRAVAKGVTAITMALLGFGVWSLVFGQLVGTTLSVLAYWWVVPWRPAFRFNSSQVHSLLGYGLNIVSVRALSAVLLNTDYLLVGRFLGTTALGVYSLAFRIPNLLIGQFADVIGQVLFPLYTKLGDEPEAQIRGVLASIRYVALVTAPLGLGLALVAEPFILTVFTEKWIDAVPVLTAISVATVLDTLGHNFGDVYKARGCPDILTKLSIVRALILIPALWWAVSGPGTLMAVSWTVAGTAFVGVVLQCVIASQVLNISIVMILGELHPAAVGSSSMTVTVLAVLALCPEAMPVVQLSLTVSVGGIAYLGTLWLVHREVLYTAVETIRRGLARRR